MESGTETDIRKLLDRAAISDLILRYSRGVDSRDWDQVASCFTPDADIDYGLARGGVEEMVDWIRRGVEVFDNTMHFVEPRIVEMAAGRASVDTYGLAYHGRTEAGQRRELVVKLRYLDELVREGAAWLIKKRTVEYVFGREDEVVLQE